MGGSNWCGGVVWWRLVLEDSLVGEVMANGMTMK